MAKKKKDPLKSLEKFSRRRPVAHSRKSPEFYVKGDVISTAAHLALNRLTEAYDTHNDERASEDERERAIGLILSVFRATEAGITGPVSRIPSEYFRFVDSLCMAEAKSALKRYRRLKEKVVYSPITPEDFFVRELAESTGLLKRDVVTALLKADLARRKSGGLKLRLYGRRAESIRDALVSFLTGHPVEYLRPLRNRALKHKRSR
jgi:hypothetical protein